MKQMHKALAAYPASIGLSWPTIKGADGYERLEEATGTGFLILKAILGFRSRMVLNALLLWRHGVETDHAAEMY